MFTHKQIANKIGIESGNSRITVRELIKKAIFKFELPVGGFGKGYALIVSETHLHHYLKILERRISNIELRKKK